jgi:hypothetical protein
MQAMKKLDCNVGAMLCLIALLTACRSTSATDAPVAPTRPEVTLRETQPGQIQQVARQLFSERGYKETASPLFEELIFDRPIQPESSNRALRVRLRLVALGGEEWRLTGISLGVERWKTELETETVVGAGYSQIQDILETIKLRVEQVAL